jgi:hypothetical protein
MKEIIETVLIGSVAAVFAGGAVALWTAIIYAGIDMWRNRK